MLPIFLKTLAITAPVFFMLFLGLVLKRVNWIDDNFIRVASGLVFNVTMPALLFLGILHADLHAAMNNIQDEIDLVGESAASIDAYAATDPAECFAVLSEYFFSAPELFAPRFPALWQRFCHFYQQDPLQRIRAHGGDESTNLRVVH